VPIKGTGCWLKCEYIKKNSVGETLHTVFNDFSSRTSFWRVAGPGIVYRCVTQKVNNYSDWLIISLIRIVATIHLYPQRFSGGYFKHRGGWLLGEQLYVCNNSADRCMLPIRCNAEWLFTFRSLLSRKSQK